MRRALFALLLQAAATAAQPTCLTSSPHSLSIDYTVTPKDEWDLHYVTLSVPAEPNGEAVKPFALMTTTTFPVTVSGLQPGTRYAIAVRSHPRSQPTIAWGPGWSAPSDAIVCTTPDSAAPREQIITPGSQTVAGSKFLRVYRISEYSFDVDFLPNHDAADAQSMPLYLMTCDPMGNCAPWDTSDLTKRWDGCQAALQAACPTQRGGAFGCMKCADQHRTALEAACGPWSDEDTMDGEGSFGVHWYCGVGWPESVAEQGPITEYCVEYLPVGGGASAAANATASQALGEAVGAKEAGRLAGGNDGFSGYLSCNSDEVDALGNDPRNPSCICICYDDRLLAHQTLEELKRDCYVGELPWVNETVCNCTGGASPIPAEGNPSLTHVGRAPVYLPYGSRPTQVLTRAQPRCGDAAQPVS